MKNSCWKNLKSGGLKKIAITEIKKLKTGLSKLIDYAMNPSKTTDIIEYHNGMENEKVVYVRGINCTPEFAKTQMQETKDRFNKHTGNVGYHIIQSFDDNEGTNEQVFEIGCKLAEELFGDRFEVIVALHKNTDNLHCHIVVNSVSFVDGLKFNDNKTFLHRTRNVSDRLCRENGLSVIENPKPSKHQCYPQYIAERDGQYNKFTTLKKDIDECVLRATSIKGFFREMKKLEYTFDFRKPHITVNHPSFKRPVWLSDLGDEYSYERICDKVMAHWKTYRIDLPEQDDWENYLYDFERNYREVYVHFVTIVEAAKSRPKENYYIEKYLQSEIIKLDRLIEERNLLCHNDIEMPEQLQAYKENCISEMAEVTDARKILRNKLKCAVRKGDESEILNLKSEISLFSERLKILRKDIKICERIEEKEPDIESKLDKVLEVEAERKNKENLQNRSSRSYSPGAR